MSQLNQEWMRLAIDKAREGIGAGQSPFGACIVRDGKLLSSCHNKVWHSNDCTAHAEVLALREACRALDSIDLSGCEIYSTCEPCPMCFAASHWAKIKTIYFGCSVEDALALGFNELTLSNQQMKTLGGSPIEIVPGLLREECLAVFKHWEGLDSKTPY